MIVAAPMQMVTLIRLSRARSLAARHPLLERIGRATLRPLLRSGLVTWGTKSFEFWTVLMAALQVVRPSFILELGSGRSTAYLAEYAGKSGARLVSLEQSRVYRRRVRLGLRKSFLPADSVHLAPIEQDGWYDQRALDRLVTEPVDCLFVDGPVGIEEALGRGARNIGRAREWLSRQVQGSRLLIVDDVHRPAVSGLLEALLDANPLETRYIAYEPQPEAWNVLSISASASDLEVLTVVAEALGIELHDRYPERRPSPRATAKAIPR